MALPLQDYCHTPLLGEQKRPQQWMWLYWQGLRWVVGSRQHMRQWLVGGQEDGTAGIHSSWQLAVVGGEQLKVVQWPLAQQEQHYQHLVLNSSQAGSGSRLEQNDKNHT